MYIVKVARFLPRSCWIRSLSPSPPGMPVTGRSFEQKY